MLTQTQIATPMANRVLTPEFYYGVFQGFASSTSWTVTDILPSEGNLMVLCIGGSQSRTATWPSGWNVIVMTGSTNTLDIGYKIAGPSEGSSINITFNAGLQGSAHYYEFRNVDKTNPFVSGGVASTFSAATSFSAGSYNVVDAPCVIITDIQFTAAITWTIDDGYTIIGSTARHSAAYKIYPINVASQVTTWSGASATGSAGSVIFRGQQY